MTEPALAKYLRWFVYASALVPLVIFAQYMSPFHFGKVIVFRALVEAMIVLYILLVWRDRSYLPKAHPITWAFLAFTLAFTITTITSVAPLQSLWGTLERMGGLWTFWHYFVFYVIAVSVMRTRGHWTQLLHLMVAVGAVSAIYGFLQKTGLEFILGSGGRARPFGTIGNPALFAGYQILVAYLAVTLVAMKHFGPNETPAPHSAERGGKLIGAGLGGALLLALLLPGHGLWVVPLGISAYGVYLLMAGLWNAGKWFYVVAAAFMFLAAISTAVRGSLLAIVVGTVLFALLWSTLNRSRKGKALLLAAVAGVVLFFFLAMLLHDTPMVKNSPYLTRITDFSSDSFTVQTRFWAWSAGLKGWSESPRYMLLGWGPENFNIPFSKYFNPKFFTGPGAETFFDRAHNMFIEVLVTMGLVGELTYLALFAMLLWTLAKFMKAGGDQRTLGIGLTAMTVAYAIHNAFIFDTSANFLTFFTILAFVVHVAQRGLEGEAVAAIGPRHKSVHRPFTAGQLAAGAALTLVVVPLIYSTNVKPTLANYAVTRAIVAGWQGDFVGAVNDYRRANAYDTIGRYEFRHRFAQYILELTASADVSNVPDFDKVTLEAIEELKKNAAENPLDYLPLLYLSRLYITLGNGDPASPYNDTALEYSMAALQISPTFVRTYYEIAQVYLNKKEYDKAYEWFAKARDLNPDVGVTHWYLGIVRMQQGQATKDNKFIQQGIQHSVDAIAHGYVLTEGDAQKLAGAYIALGDFKNVIALYKQLIVAFPKVVLYREQLIALYLHVGDQTSAVAAIREALAQPEIGANAEFRAKAEAVLKDLGIKK